MVINKAASFVRQPSTVLGLSALIGTFTAFLTGQLTWQGAVPAIAGALAAVLLPDNSSAQAAVKEATAAIVLAEQAVVNTPTKQAILVGVGRAPTTMALLMIAGFGLSACAVQPGTKARTLAELQIAYAAAHAAEINYVSAPRAANAIATQLVVLDESALAALAAYSAAPTDTVLAQSAELTLTALVGYGATQVRR